MCVQGVKISNVKFSLKVTLPSSEILNILSRVSKKRSVSYYNSFCVIRAFEKNKTFVFIVYYKGHVNVTGLKGNREISSACRLLKKWFKRHNLVGFKVDNFTASSTLTYGSLFEWPRSFLGLLTDIKDKFVGTHLHGITKYSLLNIHCHRQKFPGAFLKYSVGTVILFASGKFNIVGVKKKQHIREMCQDMNAIVSYLQQHVC